MAYVVRYKRVRAQVDFSNIKEKLVKTLKASKKREINRISNFLKCLSSNLIKYSPTTASGSPFSKNRYVNNTRIYFTNNKTSYQNDNASWVTSAIPYIGDETGSVPSQIKGLQECLAVLASGFLPNSIAVINNSKTHTGYPYWYHIEEIGWKSETPETDTKGNPLSGYKKIQVRRMPYHTFQKAWRAANAKYGIKRGVTVSSKYDTKEGAGNG